MGAVEAAVAVGGVAALVPVVVVVVVVVMVVAVAVPVLVVLFWRPGPSRRAYPTVLHKENAS